MEPSADPAESANPADPSDPSDPSEARAKQRGKWALVRTLNHALKSYAVLPVRPVLGGGGCTRGKAPRASVSPPGGNWVVAPSARVHTDRALWWGVPSLIPSVNLAQAAPPCAWSFCIHPRWRGQIPEGASPAL